MLGNIHNEVLQCYIYSPIVREEWELHMSLLSNMSQVYALLPTLPLLDKICP